MLLSSLCFISTLTHPLLSFLLSFSTLPLLLFAIFCSSCRPSIHFRSPCPAYSASLPDIPASFFLVLFFSTLLLSLFDVFCSSCSPIHFPSPCPAYSSSLPSIRSPGIPNPHFLLFPFLSQSLPPSPDCLSSCPHISSSLPSIHSPGIPNPYFLLLLLLSQSLPPSLTWLSLLLPSYFFFLAPFFHTPSLLTPFPIFILFFILHLFSLALLLPLPLSYSLFHFFLLLTRSWRFMNLSWSFLLSVLLPLLS